LILTTSAIRVALPWKKVTDKGCLLQIDYNTCIGINVVDNTC